MYATLKEDFTAAQLDQLMGALADNRIPVVGLQRGGYTVQLGVTSSLDETGVISKIKLLPAIKSTDFLYPNSANGAAASLTNSLADNSQLLTSRWWEQTAGFVSARRKLNLTAEKECKDITVRTVVADDLFANGHGATVTLFLAGSGNNNNAPVRGACPNLPTGQVVSTGHEGLKFSADSGYQMINLSRGSGFADFCLNTSFFGCTLLRQGTRIIGNRRSSEQTFRYGMLEGLRQCEQTGCLVIKGAGNDGLKNDDQLFNSSDNSTTADLLRWQNHAIVVGATNQYGTDATFSRMGKAVDILAPGDGIGFHELSDKPASGTSFAAPLLSAAAVLMKHAMPSIRAPEIKRLLLATGNSIAFQSKSALAGDNRFKIDYYQEATWPNKTLNADAAVDSTLALSKVSLNSSPPVPLPFGQTRNVEISVTRPSRDQLLDVVFLFDVSSSTNPMRTSFSSSANQILNSILGTNPSAAFSVATFSDFPTAAYPGDRPFALLQSISTNRTLTVAKILEATQRQEVGGSDIEESQLDAIYQISTGTGWIYDDYAIAPTNMSWRTGAKKIIILLTDADYKNSDLYPREANIGYARTVAAAKAAGVSVFTLLPSTSDFEIVSSYTNLANDTSGKVILQSNSSSAAIASAVGTAVSSAFNQPETITLERVLGDSSLSLVSNVSPASYANVVPGQTVKFNVTLYGLIPSPSLQKLDYTANTMLWATSKSATSAASSLGTIIGRFDLPTIVPKIDLEPQLANSASKAFLKAVREWFDTR